MTLVLNLVGGPGTGKSTTAAGTFFELKQRGINCEYVQEYAKDVVWGRTTATLDNQLYVFAKQHHRIFRLLGQVDVIVTDCPLFLSLYYGDKLSHTFKKLVLEEFLALDSLTVYLRRVKPFNPAGRTQSEEKAREIDSILLSLLSRYQVPHHQVIADRMAPQICTDLVLSRIVQEHEPLVGDSR